MIILASKSPRRKQLLSMMGLEFTVQTADIDETMDPSQTPAHEVAAVSARKAEKIAAQHPQDVLKHKEIADPVIHLGRNAAYQRVNVRNGIQRVQHEPYQNQHPDDVFPGAEIGCALLSAGNQGHGGNQG